MCPNEVTDCPQVDAIPLVDIAPLVAGSEASSRAVAEAFAEACETIGFFYVVNHGVAQTIVDDAFAAAERFFALPLEQRMAIQINRWNRGYMKMREVTIPGYAPDVKESFDLGVDLAPDAPEVLAGKPLHGSNQWPAMAGFRAPVERYFAAALDLARHLLKGFAIALDLDPDAFIALHEPPLASMRLLHYPPNAAYAVSEHGCGPHTDYGALTILAQDSVGGLEVRRRDGAWIAAPSIPGSFVINIGDMMASWTNDRFTSNPHRVFNRSTSERFSIPLFVSPAYDTLVECFPSCQSADNPPKYPPVKSGEYLLRKFDSTYAFRKKAGGDVESAGSEGSKQRL